MFRVVLRQCLGVVEAPRVWGHTSPPSVALALQAADSMPDRAAGLEAANAW